MSTRFQPGSLRASLPPQRKMLCYAGSFTPDELRFWGKVKCGDGCWEWRGVKSNGYGAFYAKGRRWISSRYAWEDTHGAIPDNLFVLHRCDNPACVRPDHLFLGTHTDNMRDMVAKGRQRNGVLLGERHGNSKLSNADVAAIRVRLVAGESQHRLAKEYGVTKPTIARAAFGDTWKHVASPCATGAGIPATPPKLTPHQVYEIRRRIDSGERVSHLAREFGVSWTTADRIGRRLDWRSLPEADRSHTTVMTPGEF